MRTILNIHGYGGSAHNSAYTALRSLDCHVISPQLDYAAESPVQTLETLRNIVKEGEVDALAGTSFGGFFAALLCTEFRLPAMLVNPCLLPFDVLPRIGYPQPIQPLMALFGRLAAWNSSLVHCIIGGADEVIGDHAFTKRLLNHAALQIVPDGKHSGATLPLPSFFQTALAETAELHPMQVQIASRRESEAIIAAGTFPRNTAVISFYDPATKQIDKAYIRMDYSRVCDHVFYCELDDLDLDVLERRGVSYKAYFPEADDLAKFILTAHAQGMDILCQCEYGQSRSAGCAAAILEYFYHTGISVFADYKRYPNQVVYHKVLDALERNENGGT